MPLKIASPRQGPYPVDPDKLLAAISRTRRALHTLRQLASLLPVMARNDAAGEWTEYRPDGESLADALVSLEVEGLVEIWPDAPSGPVVILSALSAERLGLELDGTGRKWRQILASRRGSRLKRRARIKDEVEAGIFSLDEVAEPVHRDPGGDLDDVQPRILLGERLIWNGPEQMEGRHYTTLSRCLIVCPGCMDKPLAIGHYCLACNGRAKGEKLPQVRATKLARCPTAKTRREARAQRRA